MQQPVSFSMHTLIPSTNLFKLRRDGTLGWQQSANDHPTPMEQLIGQARPVSQNIKIPDTGSTMNHHCTILSTKCSETTSDRTDNRLS